MQEAMPVSLIMKMWSPSSSGDGRVADEASFAARGEEAGAHGMIVAIGSQNESSLGIVQLAGDGAEELMGYNDGGLAAILDDLGDSPGIPRAQTVNYNLSV